MSYLVLARKYRPQTFEQLVGQAHVTTTLINALDAKRLAHAYIFSGPRGCGKTTTARLLAKALNCVKGPTPAPCGTCDRCVEIAAGNSPDDVLEIDGASNRGIDQIRELRETVRYVPARARYRIYIIDEAHQITEAAFNALLKTLEEPPAHAVFMMATTEAQKIPATILSRCQRFQLRSIAPAEIQKQLRMIVDAEKLKVDDAALLEVARTANGSLRDALSLLDQVIAYAPDGAAAADIRVLLGLLPQELVRSFAGTLRDGRAEQVLQAVQKAVEDGFDIFQLSHDLLAHWHRLFLWKNGVPDDSVAQSADLKAEAGDYTLPGLERLLQVLADGAERMRRSESPRVSFELTCLELAKKPVPVDELLARLEGLEAALRKGGASSAPDLSKKKSDLTPVPLTAGAPAGRPAGPRETGPSLRTALPESAAPAAPVIQPRSFTVPVTAAVETARPALSGAQDAPLSTDQARSAWPQFLLDIGRQKPSLESFLANARWEVRTGNRLAILCAQEFHRQQIVSHLGLLDEILRRHLPAPFQLLCAVEETPATAAPKAAVPAPVRPMTAGQDDEYAEVAGEPPAFQEEDPAEEPADSFIAKDDGSTDLIREAVAADPSLKKVLDRFPGKLKKIQAAPAHE